MKSQFCLSKPIAILPFFYLMWTFYCLVALQTILYASCLCLPSSLYITRDHHCLSYVFPSPSQSQFFRYLIPQPKATDGKHRFIFFTSKKGEQGEHKYHYSFPRESFWIRRVYFRSGLSPPSRELYTIQHSLQIPKACWVNWVAEDPNVEIVN